MGKTDLMFFVMLALSVVIVYGQGQIDQSTGSITTMNQERYSNNDVLVFSEDFTSNGKNWREVSDDDGVAESIANGKLSISLPCNYDQSFYVKVPYIGLEKDFIIEADATASQSDKCWYSLTFRSNDSKGCYDYFISNDGYYSLRKFNTTTWSWIFIVPPSFNQSIKVGQQTNKMKVIANGNRFTLYVNDVMLGTWMDNDFPEGSFGMHIESDKCVTVSYDNIKIWETRNENKISELLPVTIQPLTITPPSSGQTSQSTESAVTTTTMTTDLLYWSFDKGFDGWERTGSVPPWHTMESGIQWFDQWGGAQGVIVIDACESTPGGYQEVHAKGGIKKSVTLPKNADKIIFNVVRVNHDGGIRFLLIDSEGQHTLGEEVLTGVITKQLSYDISAWNGKEVTLEVQTFGAGTDASDCIGSSHGCGSCCSEYIGIDWVMCSSSNDDKEDCIYIYARNIGGDLEKAALIKAYFEDLPSNNFKNIIIEIHPLKGKPLLPPFPVNAWEVPYTSKDIWKQIKIMVGEVKIGYDENVSVITSGVSVDYCYSNGKSYALGSSEGVAEEYSAELTKTILGDVVGIKLPMVPVGTLMYFLEKWIEESGAIDISKQPTNIYLNDMNKYDQYMISWPAVNIDVINKKLAISESGGLKYPSYIRVKIPLEFENSYKSDVFIYTKLLLQEANEGTPDRCLCSIEFKLGEGSECDNEAIEWDMSSAKDWVLRGQALGASFAPWEDVLDCFDTAIKIDKSNGEAWHGKALALQGLGKNIEADAAFAKAKELGYTG